MSDFTIIPAAPGTMILQHILYSKGSFPNHQNPDTIHHHTAPVIAWKITHEDCDPIAIVPGGVTSRYWLIVGQNLYSSFGDSGISYGEWFEEMREEFNS